MTTVKPNPDFKSGQTLSNFDSYVEYAYENSDYLTLDLSDVIYMDSGSFRWVFENSNKFKKILYPKSEYVINNYNLWVESKKWKTK